MMYGFGDVAAPLPESVEFMEQLVVDYTTLILQKCTDTALLHRNTSRVLESDLLFVIRKDQPRLNRALQLLEAFDEQKRTQKEHGDSMLNKLHLQEGGQMEEEKSRLKRSLK